MFALAASGFLGPALAGACWRLLAFAGVGLGRVAKVGRSRSFKQKQFKAANIESVCAASTLSKRKSRIGTGFCGLRCDAITIAL